MIKNNGIVFSYDKDLCDILSLSTSKIFPAQNRKLFKNIYFVNDISST